MVRIWGAVVVNLAGWFMCFFCGFFGGSKGVKVDEHDMFICLLFCLLKILIHKWLVTVVF